MIIRTHADAARALLKVIKYIDGTAPKEVEWEEIVKDVQVCKPLKAWAENTIKQEDAAKKEAKRY